MKSILVLGGDGFCGWPTALHLSANGFRVGIVDNLSRRRIDEELKASSLTPIASIGDRLAAWKKASSEDITFYPIDVAHDYQACAISCPSSSPMRSFISPNSAPRPIR